MVEKMIKMFGSVLLFLFATCCFAQTGCQIGISYTPPSCATCCDGSATIVSYTGCAPVSYTWSTGATGTSAYGLCPGTYSVTADDGGLFGCCGLISSTVTITPNIVADFKAPIVCQDTATCFTDSSISYNGAIIGYSWWFGDGNTSTQMAPCNHYAAPGNYTVTLIVVNSNGDRDTISKPVQVYPLPTVSCYASPDTINPSNQVTTLNATSPGITSVGSYYWTPPYNISNQPGPVASANPFVDTCYVVTVNDTNGCKNTCQACVKVDYTLQQAEHTKQSELIVPNPNSGTFTLFYDPNLADEIEILDVLGRLIIKLKLSTELTQLNIIMKHEDRGVFFCRIHSRNGRIANQKIIITE